SLQTRVSRLLTPWRARVPAAVPGACLSGDRPVECHRERAGHARALSRVAVEPGDPPSNAVAGTILLWLDMPARDAEPHGWQHPVGEKDRSQTHRFQPLQTVANLQILSALRFAGGRLSGQRAGRNSRPDRADRAFARAFDSTGWELRVADDRQLQASAFPPRFPAGSDVHRHPGAQPADHPLVVPRAVPDGSAVGPGLSLVYSGSGEAPCRMRRLQPLLASLPGRGRSHSRRTVA